MELDKITKTHRQVFDDLRKAEINVNLHYIPVHTHPFYRKLGFNYGDFPEAESYYREAISLPIFYGLNEVEQKYIINVLKSSLFNESDVS